MRTNCSIERFGGSYKGTPMEDKDNGSGDLPTMEEPNETTLTPGESMIMQKLGEMEGRLQKVETPQKQEVSPEPEPPKTQVNSVREALEPGVPALFKAEDGFLFYAPPEYEGDICPHCHMPPLEYCAGGVVGIDPETGHVQTDPEGRKGSYLACRQKVKWRDEIMPIPVVSTGETKLREPRPVVSRFSDIETDAKDDEG